MTAEAPLRREPSAPGGAEERRELANNYYYEESEMSERGEGWVRVRIRRDLRTKRGLAFAAGEVTLAKKGHYHGPPAVEYYEAFSVKNALATWVDVADVEVL